MKPFSIVKFVFVCFFVAFLSACATAKAPLPPVGISNVSHGDFKYSGEYLELPGGKKWRNGKIVSYLRSTDEFFATVALVMAKRPELFERQKNSNSKFASRCKSDLNNLINSSDFPYMVRSKNENRYLVVRCLVYVANGSASYAKTKIFDVNISVFADLFGIRFKTVDTNGEVVDIFHGNPA